MPPTRRPALPDAPRTPPGPSDPNVLSEARCGKTSTPRCKGRPHRRPPGSSSRLPSRATCCWALAGLCRETPPFRVNAAAARRSPATRSRVLRRDREGRTRSSGVSVRPNAPGGCRHHAGFSNTLILKRDFQKDDQKIQDIIAQLCSKGPGGSNKDSPAPHPPPQERFLQKRTLLSGT